AGPPTKTNFAGVKRSAIVVAGVLLAVMLGSFFIKNIQRTPQPGLDALPAQKKRPSALAQKAEKGTAQRAPYVSQSNPEVASVSELAQPWSSKRFVFRSLTLSKDVPALIVRMPAPASESKSYWAFSLEAPFTQCQFAYIDDLAKLSSEYGFEASHPM